MERFQGPAPFMGFGGAFLPARRRAYRASTRAGVLLCQGVPATQSRSSLRVRSLGPTPAETLRPSGAGKSRPSPFGKERWPRCMRSETFTNTSTLPRRVVSLARFPSAIPMLLRPQG